MTDNKLLTCGEAKACDATKSRLPLTKILWIIRGLPGSGKTTLAKLLQLALHTDHWYEADMYFEDYYGHYTFSPHQLGDAHDWCQRKVKDAMQADACDIIVSNTTSQAWEAMPYLGMATAYHYQVQVIECQGQFGSIHNVPLATIEKMQQRWEPIS